MPCARARRGSSAGSAATAFVTSPLHARRHAAAEQPLVDQRDQLRRVAGDRHERREVDVRSRRAGDLAVGVVAAAVDHVVREVHPVEHRVRVVDAELRRDERRAGDAEFGRVVVEHRRRVEDVLAHRARRLVEADAVADRAQLPQERRDVEHRLAQLPVARSRSSRRRAPPGRAAPRAARPSCRRARPCRCRRMPPRRARRRPAIGLPVTSCRIRCFAKNGPTFGMQEHVVHGAAQVGFRRSGPPGTVVPVQQHLGPVSWSAATGTIGFAK